MLVASSFLSLEMQPQASASRWFLVLQTPPGRPESGPIVCLHLTQICWTRNTDVAVTFGSTDEAAREENWLPS